MNWYKTAKLKEVKLVGTLKQADDGFVYLDINNKLIEGLFELIDNDEIVKTPYNQKQYNSIGAHVTVMYSDEVEKKGIKLKEVGKKFNFTLGELKSTKPQGWDGVDEVFFLQIYSEELENLRKKYGLSKKLDGHEYHITVALDK
jgi:hypothetical protein